MLRFELEDPNDDEDDEDDDFDEDEDGEDGDEDDEDEEEPETWQVGGSWRRLNGGRSLTSRIQPA